jgi:hypothetical protein
MIEVLWLPDAPPLPAVLRSGRPIWHRNVEQIDAARCSCPGVDRIAEAPLCAEPWEELRAGERR